MKIGIVKEIKNNENRVGATPSGVKEYVKNGHTVLVETNAGINSGFTDADYVKAGAKIVKTPKEAWNVDMVIKVKEPLKQEYEYMKKQPNETALMLYTYLHLAANKELTQALLDNKVTGIAYETMVRDGRLPLLAPMSRVAGRRAVIVAATALEKHKGGLGMLPGGVEGTEKGLFVVVGGGVAGYNAAATAMGLGTNVEIFEANPNRIEQLKADKTLNKLAEVFGSTIKIIKSEPKALMKSMENADAVISTILIPGALAKKVITEAMVKKMRKGSVIVDIAIDQGGSVETIDHATTHDNPTFEKFGVLHYSVANMPGATPRTSTAALEAATLEYGLKLANQGIQSALDNNTILTGINTIYGYLTDKAVWEAFKKDYKLEDARAIIVSTTTSTQKDTTAEKKPVKKTSKKPASKKPTKKTNKKPVSKKKTKK